MAGYSGTPLAKKLGQPSSSVGSTGWWRGLVDNKVCAIDDTWSGLRLVIRLENR